MRLDPAVPYAWKARKAQALIRLAGLQGKEKSRIGGRLPGGIMVRGLSGGEKRRLSLVCGVMTNPEILFCDEATSGASMASMACGPRTDGRTDGRVGLSNRINQWHGRDGRRHRRRRSSAHRLTDRLLTCSPLPHL